MVYMVTMCHTMVMASDVSEYFLSATQLHSSCLTLSPLRHSPAPAVSTTLYTHTHTHTHTQIDR